MTTPGPALNSPILGSGANPTVAAMAAVAKQIKGLAAADCKIVGGTVLDASPFFTTQSNISVQIDGAPAAQPTRAHVLGGNVPATGTRVLLLLYPPRGVVALGQISDSILIEQTGASTTFPGFNFASLQTFQAVGTQTASGGILYLNNAGGTVISTPMRNQYARDLSGPHTLTPSASFVLYGASMQIKLPGSGIIMIQHKTRLTSLTGTTGPFTFFADVIVQNLTQSTTPYGGSTNNSFNYVAAAAANPLVGVVDINGFLSVGGSASAQGGILGNLGDTMNVGIAYAATGGSGGTWVVAEDALSLTPGF